MKKWISIFFILFNISIFAYEAKVENFIVKNDTLKFNLNGGVYIHNKQLTLKGCKNKNVKLLGRLYIQGKKIPTIIRQIKPNKNIYYLKNIRLKISLSEIYSLWSSGMKTASAIFMVYIPSKKKVVSGSYQRKVITLYSYQNLKEFNEIMKQEANAQIEIRETLTKIKNNYYVDIIFGKEMNKQKYNDKNYKYNQTENKLNLSIRNNIKWMLLIFNQIPKDFIVKSKLKTIAFVKDLYYKNSIVGGGFFYKQNTVIIVLSSFKENTQRRFTHEYFHFLEYIFYKNKEYIKKWRKLNPVNFRYLPHKKIYKTDPKSLLREHPEPGLVNGYCKADVYQDRAEVFSYFFVPTLKKKAIKWLKTDSFLKSKFLEMKNILLENSPNFSFH